MKVYIPKLVGPINQICDHVVGIAEFWNKLEWLNNICVFNPAKPHSVGFFLLHILTGGDANTALLLLLQKNVGTINLLLVKFLNDCY